MKKIAICKNVNRNSTVNYTLTLTGKKLTKKLLELILACSPWRLADIFLSDIVLRLRQSTYLTDVQLKLILRKVPHPSAYNSSAYKIQGIRARRIDFFKELSITGNTNTPTLKTVYNFKKINFIRTKNSTISYSYCLKGDTVLLMFCAGDVLTLFSSLVYLFLIKTVFRQI